jgi:alkylated DNA repair dioxygenase AlkB
MIIEKERLPEYLEVYGKILFNKMMRLRPQEKGMIIKINNKDKTHVEFQTERYHKSYLKTPRFDKNIHGNYMFGLYNEKFRNIPDIFEPFFNFINKNEITPFNQVTINWFDNPEDFIPKHIDCQKQLIENSDILILSLGSDRQMVFLPKGLLKTFEITVKHGDIIVLKNQTGKNLHSHGIKSTDDLKNYKRISLSFRKYKI